MERRLISASSVRSDDATAPKTEGLTDERHCP